MLREFNTLPAPLNDIVRLQLMQAFCVLRLWEPSWPSLVGFALGCLGIGAVRWLISFLCGSEDSAQSDGRSLADAFIFEAPDVPPTGTDNQMAR